MSEERVAIVRGGDLFEACVEALVNPVNCVGTLGKGLALAFKQRFPAIEAPYKAACRQGNVAPGRVQVLDVTPAGDSPVRYVVNFPTKRHWRDRSRLDDIEAGLDSLEAAVNAIGIASIAIPALGCGLGGLAWRDVEPLLLHAADRMNPRVIIFAP